MADTAKERALAELKDEQDRKKMARGGGIEQRGKTKGKMV